MLEQVTRSSPVYDTVTVCVPRTVKVAVAVALPEVRPTGDWAVPSIVKVTVPVGVPEPGATADTVAVKVTVSP